MSEPNTEAYSASKGGIIALNHAMAISLGERRIRVNCVAPGWIETPRVPAKSKRDHEQHPGHRRKYNGIAGRFAEEQPLDPSGAAEPEEAKQPDQGTEVDPNPTKSAPNSPELEEKEKPAPTRSPTDQAVSKVKSQIFTNEEGGKEPTALGSLDDDDRAAARVR